MSLSEDRVPMAVWIAENLLGMEVDFGVWCNGNGLKCTEEELVGVVFSANCFFVVWGKIEDKKTISPMDYEKIFMRLISMRKDAPKNKKENIKTRCDIFYKDIHEVMTKN